MFRQKYYFHTLLFFTISFIFTFWFIRGFNSVLSLDGTKEMVNNVILLKFPNTLFNKITSGELDQIWHTARWSADIIPYISLQIVGKFYAFITNNPVYAGFFALGFLSAFYYTLLTLILALYIRIPYKIPYKSYTFVFLLFYLGIITTILYIFNINFPFFQDDEYVASFNAHYLFTTILMLLSLYPFWISFFQNTWNEKYNHIYFKVLWYIIIFFTAFSSTGVTSLFFLVQSFIGLYITIFIAPKRIDQKLIFLFVNPPTYIKALYFGGTLCIIALLSESLFGHSHNSVKMNLSLVTENIILLIKMIAKYSIIFMIIYLSYLTYYLLNKNTNIKFSFFQIDKLIIITLLCHILTILYIFFLFTKRNHAYNSYQIPILIIMILVLFLVTLPLIIKLNSPIVYSFLFMFFFSHYLYYIPHYPKNQVHKKNVLFYQYIYEQNKIQTNKMINIYQAPYREEFSLYHQLQTTTVLEIYAKDIGLIDSDVTLIYKGTNK